LCPTAVERRGNPKELAVERRGNPDDLAVERRGNPDDLAAFPTPSTSSLPRILIAACHETSVAQNTFNTEKTRDENCGFWSRCLGH
jgi:hypothetical protein